MSYNKKYLAPSTISTAKNSQLYDQNQINWMISTQNSIQPGDVIIHRGIEKTLLDEMNFHSPSYSENNKIIHGYDNKPKKVPRN